MKLYFAGASRSFLLAAAALILAVAPSSASAAVASTWTADSYQDFAEGSADSALITSSGEVRPGWNLDELQLDFGAAWAATFRPDGTLFLGSGEGARIYAVRGGGYRELAAIEGAVAVVSLASGADGTLYAGTMPGGEVWAVDPETGATRRVAALEGVETVWALSLDRSGQRLYAGTGPDGALYEIDVRLKLARKVFETGDRRILSMLTARDGQVWIGTSGEGLVFRFDPRAGAGRAVADFAAEEVKALAEVEGGVIAAVNQFQEPQGGRTSAKAQGEATGGARGGIQPRFPEQGSGPGTEDATASRQGERKGKGALFRVSAGGEIHQLHALATTYYTSLAAGKEGVFAGAAEGGRVFLLEADGSVSSAFEVPQRMVDQLAYHAERGLAFTTADSGALYRAGPATGRSLYTSKIFDSGDLSRFGTLLLRGSGELSFETRSGNTSLPGPGWSAWERPRRESRGGPGVVRGEVASPPGRYFQYRVSLGRAPAGELQQSVLYYLPQNRSTRIKTARVQRARSAPTSLATMKPGSGAPRSPVLTFEWTVENPDGDDTAYDLAVRREGDEHWRRIDTGGTPLTETKYEWNTEGYADGYYRLRITASDRLANDPDRALRDELVTRLFLVDNEEPRLSSVEVGYPHVSASASDEMSAVTEMAWSIDSGPWHVGTARDGLLDSPSEELVIRLPGDLAPGLHILTIRVADEAGNLGSTEIHVSR